MRAASCGGTVQVARLGQATHVVREDSLRGDDVLPHDEVCALRVSLLERVEELATREQVESAFHEINEFERMLADSGNAIVKLFLHISKKEQRRRFKKCEKDAYLRWKVKPEDWRHFKQYDDYHAAIEEMLEKTSTQHAPWHICECEDRRFGEIEAFTSIIEGIETRLKVLGKNPSIDDAGRILKPKSIPAHLAGKKPERRRGAPVAAGALARAGNGKKR